MNGSISGKRVAFQLDVRGPDDGSFGWLLGDVRLRNKAWSQAVLAERGEVEHSFVSRLETNARSIREPNLRRLCEALEATPEQCYELYRRAGFFAKQVDSPLIGRVRALLDRKGDERLTLLAIRSITAILDTLEDYLNVPAA